MNRRRFLESVGIAATVATAGCAGVLGSGAPSAVSVDDGLITAAISGTWGYNSIDYYDDQTGSIQQLRPTRDQWVLARLYITNDSGDRLQIDAVDDLRCGGHEEVTYILPALPGDLREDAIMHPQREMEKRGEYIPPGYSKLLNFLFDAPSDPGFTWHYQDSKYPISPKK